MNKEGRFDSALSMRTLRAASSQSRGHRAERAQSEDRFEDLRGSISVATPRAGSGAERPLPEGAIKAPLLGRTATPDVPGKIPGTAGNKPALPRSRHGPPPAHCAGGQSEPRRLSFHRIPQGNSASHRGVALPFAAALVKARAFFPRADRMGETRAIAQSVRSPRIDLRIFEFPLRGHAQGWQRRGATAARGGYQSAPPCGLLVNTGSL